MGFGWLFIGYFMTFLMSFSNYSHGIMLLGCVLMICGLARLRAYNRFFLYPIFPLIPYIVTEAYFTADMAFELFSYPVRFMTEGLGIAVELVGYAASVVFHLMLFKAIISITTDLDLGKQRLSAMRNRIVVCAYYALAFVWMLPINYNNTARQIMTIFVLLLKLSFTLLDVILLYSCYARICPQGDEEMPIRDSGIAPLDRFRRKTADRQQRIADDRVRRYREYQDSRALSRQLRTRRPTDKRKK